MSRSLWCGAVAGVGVAHGGSSSLVLRLLCLRRWLWRCPGRRVVSVCPRVLWLFGCGWLPGSGWHEPPGCADVAGCRGLIVPLGVAELPLLCRAVGLLSADVDGARCGCWCSLFWCLGGSHWVGLLLSVSLVVYSLLRCLSGHPWGWPVWCCGIPWHAEHGHLLGRVVSGLCGGG